MAQTQIFRGVETTSFRDQDGALVGVYRGTPVVRQLNRMITLKTGGWKSRTTKLRMNQFANTYCHSAFKVFQKDSQWFVSVGDRTFPFDSSDICFEI